MKIDSDLLAYPFQDEKWQNKLIVGTALGVAGVFIWPLLLPLAGYALRIMRRTQREGQPSLPEWDEWGQLFGDGLRYAVVWLVYMLPVILLVCCAIGAWVALFAAIGAGADSPAIGMAAVFGQFFGFMLIGLSMLPLAFLLYMGLVALSRLAAYGELRAAFAFGKVWRLARHGFRHYLLALVVFLGLVYLFTLIYYAVAYTFVLACLAPVLGGVGGFYMQVMLGALLGLAYRDAQAALPAVEAEPAEG